MKQGQAPKLSEQRHWKSVSEKSYPEHETTPMRGREMFEAGQVYCQPALLEHGWVNTHITWFKWIGTVAILAQGTSWADVSTPAFLNDALKLRAC